MNDAPTINPIPNQVMLSNSTKTISLSGITAGPNESGQILDVDAVSSNLAFVTATVSYVSPNSTGTLTLQSSATECGTATIYVTVMDNGGTANGGDDETTTSFGVNTFHGRFLPPLREGLANLVQKGRVVPVQITFGCPGNQSGLSPLIQLLNGDYVANAGTESPSNFLDTLSVSNADTTGVMRPVDNKYIYNLAIPTAGMNAGTPLTVRVQPLGPTGPSMYILLEIRK